MNEIYDKKANKYKYKYLKLKNEYFGAGGDVGEYFEGEYETKYAIQGIKNNKWFNSNDMLFLFISLNNINDDEGSVVKYGGSIATYNGITWIYIKDEKKYIINLNTKMKYQIYKLQLPKRVKPEIIDVTKLNEIITKQKINIECNIDNNYYDNDNLFYTLYYSEENVSEWKASENWQKNMLSEFKKLIYSNKPLNQVLLTYLKRELNVYLLFKYNNTNYISYIFNNNTKGDMNSIEFIIINLQTGEQTYIYYAHNEHNGIKQIDDNEYLTYYEQLNNGKKIPDLENIDNIKEIIGCNLENYKKSTNFIDLCSIELTNKDKKKKAFNKMALRYHPDKNENDNCHASRKILYNELMDKGKQCINKNNK
jgi:hypothetical protein